MFKEKQTLKNSFLLKLLLFQPLDEATFSSQEDTF